MKRDYDGNMPPVVLVRKVYKRSAKKRLNRAWKLKRMQMQPAEGAGNSMAGANDEKDFEDFMQVCGRRSIVVQCQTRMLMHVWCVQDLEENPEMRGEIDLYKDPAYVARQSAKARADSDISIEDDDDDDDEDDPDFPEIQLSELLDSVHLTGGLPSDGFVSGATEAATANTAAASASAAAAAAALLPDEDDPDL